MRGKVAAGLLLLLFAARGARADDAHPTVFLRGEDAVLPCLAQTEPGLRYQSVIWYKVSEAPSNQLKGLVMKKLMQNNNTILKYSGLTRDVEILEDSKSLLLPNVTLQDAGRYLCFLSAPLGHQNKQREIHLQVFDDEGRSEERSEERREESDSFYLVLAIVLLIVALLMFYVSYVSLRNTLIRHKDRSSKEARLKIAQKVKHVIVSLESKGVVSRISPQEYV